MIDFFANVAADPAETFSVTAAILTFLFSALSGVLIGLTYRFTNREANVHQNFVLTLFMLPVIMSVIILFVGSNVARAFSLAGTVSIIRFRSTAGDPKEIGYVFFSVAAGLACGVGFYVYGFLFVVLLCAVMLLLEKIGFGAGKCAMRMLKITVPESMNYADAFSEVFENFTDTAKLYGVKTADLGSVFVLTYHVVLKKDTDEKSFIDAVRCLNGNLTVALSDIPAVVK
ncbi:MAG: DUF4956 domain-containing protein [Clostridia bacterium]|nr:DUF4956 domain-containing protein [Clostridia bacterium]